MTIREVAVKAIAIYARYEENRENWTALDGGEFSGASIARAAEAEVETVAQYWGYTLDQVLDEMNLIAGEQDLDEQIESLEPDGMIDHDDEDRRAYREELNERRRPSEY